MKNIFIEGPVQTGKSTLLRKILKDIYGQNLDGIYGFTSQRIIDRDGNLLGFRLAPANAVLAMEVDATDGINTCLPNTFKWFTPNGAKVDMRVFESAGISYLNEAMEAAKSGLARAILLDEVGGHEMSSDSFRNRLYELLELDVPCVGVIKSAENTRRMDRSLMDFNGELHRRVWVVTQFEEFEQKLRENLCK